MDKSETRKFYKNISSFIEYPIIFLSDLSETFRNNEEDINDIKRLIGLLKVDNFALDMAFQKGIHPISGIEWDFNDDEERYFKLKDRNYEMIEYLEDIIKDK